MLERNGERQVLRVLTIVIGKARARAVRCVPGIFGIVRRERGRELEAAEGRAEIENLGRVVVETITGAIRSRISRNTGIGKVEIRAVGAEQVRGGRHLIAKLGIGFLVVAKANLPEGASNESIHLVDLISGVGLRVEFDGCADGEAVCQRRLAGKVDLYILFEDIVSDILCGDAGRVAEILGKYGAGRIQVAAADL